MVRLLSFFVASLAATCSVLGAPLLNNREYRIMINDTQYLTLPKQGPYATFGPSNKDILGTFWRVETFKEDPTLVTLWAQQYRRFLGYIDKNAGTPLQGRAEAFIFKAVETSTEGEYILYPDTSRNVAVGRGQPTTDKESSLAVWQRVTPLNPAIALKFILN